MHDQHLLYTGAHCNEVEEELHQIKCHEEELERKRNIAQNEIRALTSKADMLQGALGHQQVELRKSQVFSELLENKNKARVQWCVIYGCQRGSVACVSASVVVLSASLFCPCLFTDTAKETVCSASAAG